MNQSEDITTLEELLDRVSKADAEREKVSLGAILDVVGHRSFGPILVVAGLTTLAPLVGDIPGVPTVIGLSVILIAVQVLLGQERFWLPTWLRARSVERESLHKGLKWMRGPAKFVDRVLKRRLVILTRGIGRMATAVLCVAVGGVMPVMEVVPFSANLAGVALTAFGLSLLTHDGFLTLIAFAFTAGVAGVVIHTLA
jgi:hypothetical protein